MVANFSYIYASLDITQQKKHWVKSNLLESIFFIVPRTSSQNTLIFLYCQIQCILCMHTLLLLLPLVLSAEPGLGLGLG